MRAGRQPAPGAGARHGARLATVPLLVAACTGCTLPGDDPGPARLAAGAAWIALVTLSSLGLGSAALRALRSGRRPALVEVPLAAALGAVALAACAGLLGTFGALRPASLWLVLLAAAAAGVPAATRWLPRFARAAGRPPLVPLVILVVSGAWTFLVATANAPFYDQFHYHLAFPDQWLRDGGIRVFERQMYSYFPANAGLLYLYALAGPGAYAAQLMHWWFGALAAVSAGALARLAGGGRDAFWRASALVASVPSVVILSGWAGNDLAVAAFGAAAWLALLGARREATRVGALASGVLGGAAVGCKYLAAATVALPLAAGTALGSLTGSGPRAGLRRTLVALTLLAAGGLAAYAPWGVRNAALTGDPMHPFLAARVASVAPGGGDADAAASADGIAAPVAEGSRLRAALTLRVFDPQGDAGAVGPIWLIAIPAWIVAVAVARRRRAGAALLAGVLAGIALWSQFHQLGRYLVPVLVLAAAGAGATWSSLASRLGRAARGAVSLLVLVFVAWGAPSAVSPLATERLAIALGRGDENALLKRYVSYWPMIDVVNRSLPRHACVLLVAESRSLHLERAVVVEDPFQRPLLLELAEEHRTAPAMARALARRGITHVLFNAHEADRVTRMTNRAAYFEPRTADAAGALTAFFERCLARIAQEGPVALYELDASCAAGSNAPDRAPP